MYQIFWHVEIAVILRTFFISLRLYFLFLWLEDESALFKIWDIEPIHPLRLMTNMLFANSAEGLLVLFFAAADLLTS